MASAFVDELSVTAGGPNHEDSDSLHVSPDCIDLPIKQGEPKSLFLVVNTWWGSQHSGAIFEVQLKQGGEDDMGKAAPQLHPLAKIPGSFNIQSARIFSRCKLYLLLEGGWRSDDPLYDPLLRYIFDIQTGKLEPFVPHIGCKPFGTLVSAYGKLYYLATPANCPLFPEPSFECYDPAKDSWEELPSFPFFHEDWFRIKGITHYIGFAVCYGCIVFSIADYTGKFRVYAFHLSRREWCRVNAHEPFEGRAVVVGNTIYALRVLRRKRSQVMEFYFTMDENDGGCIAISLSRPSAVHDIGYVPPPYPFDEMVSQYLVHLGNQDFCYVITGRRLDYVPNQQLCVTTFQIIGEEGSSKINTLHLAAYELDTEELDDIKINFCWTLEHDDFEPEGMLPKQEEVTKCKESTLDENLMEAAACSALLGCQLTKEKVKKNVCMNVICSVLMNQENEYILCMSVFLGGTSASLVNVKFVGRIYIFLIYI